MEDKLEYYVYLMTNSHKNLLYTGVTNDLIRRVYERKHHLDKGSYTARYNIEYLVYYESTSDVKLLSLRGAKRRGNSQRFPICRGDRHTRLRAGSR